MRRVDSGRVARRRLARLVMPAFGAGGRDLVDRSFGAGTLRLSECARIRRGRLESACRSSFAAGMTVRLIERLVFPTAISEITFKLDPRGAILATSSGIWALSSAPK